MDEKMVELINALPEDLRNIITTTDSEGKVSINGTKFDEALTKSHPGEDDIIIELFFRKLCQDQWKDIGYAKIENLMPTLKHICKELGFKEEDNPFLHFVHGYILNNDKLENKDLVKVNNLYAKELISYEDLQNKIAQSDGLPSIVYVPDLYKSNNVENLVKTYIWLGNEANLEKMNWQNIYDHHISNKIDDVSKAILENDVKTINDGKSNYIRKELMFKDPSSWTLNSDEIIDKTLKLGATNPDKEFGEKPSTMSNRLSDRTSSKDIINTLTSKLRDLSIEEQRAFISELSSKLGL